MKWSTPVGVERRREIPGASALAPEELHTGTVVTPRVSHGVVCQEPPLRGARTVGETAAGRRDDEEAGTRGRS